MSHTLEISRVGHSHLWSERAEEALIKCGGRAVNDIQRITIEPSKRGGQPCIRGLVYTHPRPAPAHARASSALGNAITLDLSGLRVD